MATEARAQNDKAMHEYSTTKFQKNNPYHHMSFDASIIDEARGMLS